MNEQLLRLEEAIGLGSTYASRLLGMQYITYAQIRNGSRPLMKYHERHIEALLLLPKATLARLIEAHAYG